MIYTATFPIAFSGTADPQALVMAPGVRFTVLSPRLLRLEYDPAERFEDRPSQAFWYRRQPVPQFTVRRDDGGLEVETEYLLLHYQAGEAGFTPDTLSITLKESDTTWVYGQEDRLNLLGTARTLDNVDGALVLDQGLLSRRGWAVYDDSRSLVFSEQGWLEPRHSAAASRDLYFFGFERAYQDCLSTFAAVAGAAPLVPRWALGNWWSRYWAYSDEELLALMDEFREHDVPLSVCIVDMDWHITDTGNISSGWTGYTWNRELFPDPPGFIAALHRRGLKTALNLHPADGIYAHEAQYPAMAASMGVDPASQQPVPFDIADPQFARAYFELLHHPFEADGIDFWWMDWQQGRESTMAGLDPLWWLNHLHFYDLGRNGQKRPFIFSRWGGLGNHRYPIGFSGDALVTWESLAFQPYFTATAANVNYGWWSHDIGGHMGGVEEPELFVRWVQFGVFSPIFRLHCTNNPFHERRPWAYDAHTEAVTAAAMRLRQALIPYIYTMAWRNHKQHRPLVRPMYHDYPLQEPAYHCPDQYTFGSELVVAPYTSPAAEDTRLSRQVIWLPPGDWYDFFTAAHYAGDGWHALHGELQDIPVFARAGAIVPLAVRSGWSDTGNPQGLALYLFPGAGNEFLLYEDDGLANVSCLTPIRSSWSEGTWQIAVDPVQGDSSCLPAQRSIRLHLRGIHKSCAVTATVDGRPVDLASSYDAETVTLEVSVPAKSAEQTLLVTVSDPAGSLRLPIDTRLAAGRRLVRAFKMESWTKQRLNQDLPAIMADPRLLANYALSLTENQMRALAEVVTGSGYHRQSVRRAREEEIVLWNNGGSRTLSYQLVAEDIHHRPHQEKGPLPRFAVLHVGEKVLHFQGPGQPGGGYMTVAEWLATIAGRVESVLSGDEAGTVQFVVNEPHAVTAYLFFAPGEPPQLRQGRADQADLTIAAPSSVWLALINGKISPQEAYLNGQIQATGSIALAARLIGAISPDPAGSYLAQRWRLAINFLDVLTLIER